MGCKGGGYRIPNQILGEEALTQILMTGMLKYRVNCERVAADLRPHPYTAFVGDLEPANFELGSKRSELKERAS